MILKRLMAGGIVALLVAALSMWGLWKGARVQVKTAQDREAVAVNSLELQKIESKDLAAQLADERTRRQAAEDRERAATLQRREAATTARIDYAQIRTEIANAVSNNECSNVAVPGVVVDGLRRAADRANGLRDSRG